MPLIIFQITAVVFLIMGLALLFWIDYREGFLPDRILLPLVILGFVVVLIHPLGSLAKSDCFWGVLVGSGFMLAVRLIAFRFFKREALGWGDVKFMGMAGLWIGWQGLNPVLVSGVILSLLIATVRMRTKRKGSKTRLQSHMEIPLGPGLCVALGIVAILNLCGITPGPAFVPF